MVNLISKVAIVGVIFIGVLYQYVFKTLLFDIIGYGRQVQSIKEFPQISCKRIDELGLEGCEDMWLHEPTGYLYMACSDTRSRMQWLPACVFSSRYIQRFHAKFVNSVDFLNASGRGLTDRIAVLDTRGAGHIRDRIQWLSLDNFSGNNGDGTLNLHGFDIRADKNTDTLRMLVVNHRPPIDPVTGEALDATKVGANSTIEQFITKAGSGSMKHVRTTLDPLIQTPNNVAWVSDHAFVATNDHTAKVGFVGWLHLIAKLYLTSIATIFRCHPRRREHSLLRPQSVQHSLPLRFHHAQRHRTRSRREYLCRLHNNRGHSYLLHQPRPHLHQT